MLPFLKKLAAVLLLSPFLVIVLPIALFLLTFWVCIGLTEWAVAELSE